MAGLQDLLLLRQLQDAQDPFRSAFQSFADGVGKGIEEGRKAQMKKKKDAEDLSKFLGGDSNKSAGTKINSKEFKDRNIRVEESFTPGKGITRKLTKMTRKQILEEEKVGLEIEELRNSLNIKSVFDFDDNAVVDSTSTITNELGTPIRRGTPTGTKIGTSKSTTSTGSNIVIPKFGKEGRPSGAVDIDAKTQIEQAAADVVISKEVRSQQAKAGELAERVTLRSSATSGTAFDEVLRFNNENLKKFGFKPGAGLGILEKLQPDQLNRYKAAAQGAGREAAATVGTGIIPAARAVKMVEIFSKSTAEIGNTVEGNAANVAASMANIWGAAITTNFEIELNEKNPDGSFKKSNLKDMIKDPLTGVPLSQIQYPEVLLAISRVTEEFKLKTEDHYLEKAFNVNPDLLQPETANNIRSSRRQRRISELRSKQ